MRRVKLWEDEKSVLEESLATIERIQAAYRERLSKVKACFKLPVFCYLHSKCNFKELTLAVGMCFKNATR